MTEKLQRWLELAARPEPRERPVLSLEERVALRRLRNEALSAGKRVQVPAGLWPSLALAVFRRGVFTCLEHGDVCGVSLTLRPLSGESMQAWLARRGPKNDPSQLCVCCKQVSNG